MTVTYFSNFVGGAQTTIPIVLWAPQGYERSRVKCKVKNSSDVQIGSIIETVQNSAATDLDYITACADCANETLLPWGFVEDTEFNRAALEKDNSGTAWDKGNLTFTAETEVEVTPFAPGMILNLQLAAQQGTVKNGTRLVAYTGGVLKVHPNDLAPATHTTGVTVTTAVTGVTVDPSIATMMCYCTTSASIQWITVKVK